MGPYASDPYIPNFLIYTLFVPFKVPQKLRAHTRGPWLLTFDQNPCSAAIAARLSAERLLRTLSETALAGLENPAVLSGVWFI